MSDTITGKCLCGAVTFTATEAPDQVSVCHCEICRKWNSGPMIAVHPEGTVTIGGEESVGWYRSSDWAERGFCKTCGTSLFYRLVGTGEVILSAGALDDQDRYSGIQNHIFIDEKPDYYEFAGDAPTMTGQELFALIMAEQEKNA